jgi:hypothetical protein
MIELPTTAFGTTSLGALIDALKRCHKEADVQYDFCYLSPTTVESYRGYYNHLALGWTNREAPPYWPTVAQVLAVLEPAVNATFQGYKGGDYRMTRETPLWVANYSHTGSTGIVAIEAEYDHTVVFITKKVD